MADYTEERIIETLGLKPHPMEGGRFVETWRSAEGFSADQLPERYQGPRAHSTAIYYLLTHDTFSEMHRLRTDEVFHFYMGDCVEMLLLHPDGTGEVAALGTALAQGQRPQVVVPRGTWQGARLRKPHGYALLGCTVAPGFEVEDYESGDREKLLELYPDFSDRILSLTHPAVPLPENRDEAPGD